MDQQSETELKIKQLELDKETKKFEFEKEIRKREQEFEIKKYEARLSLWKVGIIGGSVSIITALISGFVALMLSYQETQTKLEIERTQAKTSLVLAQRSDEKDIRDKVWNLMNSNEIEDQLSAARMGYLLSPGEPERQRWLELFKELSKIVGEQGNPRDQ